MRHGGAQPRFSPNRPPLAHTSSDRKRGRRPIQADLNAGGAANATAADPSWGAGADGGAIPPAPEAYPPRPPSPCDNHLEAAPPDRAGPPSDSSPEPPGSADEREGRGLAQPEAGGATTDSAVSDASTDPGTPDESDVADAPDSATPTAQVRVVEGAGGWTFVERASEARHRPAPAYSSADGGDESAAGEDARP